MLKSFGERVAWEEEDEERIDKNFLIKASHRFSDMLRDARLKGQPHWIGDKLWQQLVSHWRSLEFQATYDKAKKNRAYEKGGSLHTGGSVSQAQHAARLEEFKARMSQIRYQTSSCSPSQSLEDPSTPLRVAYTVLETLPATTRKGPATSTSESHRVAVPVVARRMIQS